MRSAQTIFYCYFRQICRLNSLCWPVILKGQNKLLYTYILCMTCMYMLLLYNIPRFLHTVWGGYFWETYIQKKWFSYAKCVHNNRVFFLNLLWLYTFFFLKSKECGKQERVPIYFWKKSEKRRKTNLTSISTKSATSGIRVSMDSLEYNKKFRLFWADRVTKNVICNIRYTS